MRHVTYYSLQVPFFFGGGDWDIDASPILNPGIKFDWAVNLISVCDASFRGTSSRVGYLRREFIHFYHSYSIEQFIMVE